MILLLALSVLFLALKAERSKNAHLESLLAAEPKVQERVVTKTVSGPVRIITRTIERPVVRVVESPSGSQLVERIKERIVERGPSEKTTGKETIREPIQQPAPRLDRFLAGASAYPWESGKPYAIHAGYSLMNRLDFLYGYSPKQEVHQLTAIMRF